MNAKHLVEYSPEYKQRSTAETSNNSKWIEAFVSADLAVAIDQHATPLPQLLSPTPSNVNSVILNLFDELDKFDPDNRLVFASRPQSRARRPRVKLPRQSLASKKKTPIKKGQVAPVETTSAPRRKVDYSRLVDLAKPRKDPGLPSSSARKSTAAVQQPDWVQPNHIDYSHRLPAKVKDFILRTIYDPTSVVGSRSNSPSSRHKSDVDTPVAHANQESRSHAESQTNSQQVSNPIGRVALPPSAPRPSSGRRPQSSHRPTKQPASSNHNPPPSPSTKSPVKRDEKPTVEGSKPLEWSKQFGERGRRLYQKHVVEAPKKVVKPPSTLAEDLVIIASKMNELVLSKLVRILPTAIPFANDYVEAVRDANRSRGREGHDAAIDRVGAVRQRVQIIFQYVEHYCSISRPVKKDAGDKDAAEAVDDDKLEKPTSPTNKDDTEHHNADSSLPDLSDSEKAMVELLLLCKCVPNCRSMDELVIVLAWVLENVSDEEMSQTLQNYADKVQSAHEPIIQLVKSGSAINSDRVILHEKMEHRDFKQTVDDIKNHYDVSNKLFDLSLCLTFHEAAVKQSCVDQEGGFSQKYRHDQVLEAKAVDISNTESRNVSTFSFAGQTVQSALTASAPMRGKSTSALTSSSTSKSKIFSTVGGEAHSPQPQFVPRPPTDPAQPPMFANEQIVPVRPATAGKARPLGRMYAVSANTNASPRKSSYQQRFEEAKLLYLKSTESKQSPSKAQTKSNQSLGGAVDLKSEIIPCHIVMLPTHAHAGLSIFREVFSSRSIHAHAGLSPHQIHILLLEDIRHFRRNKYILQDAIAVPSQESIAQKKYAARAALQAAVHNSNKSASMESNNTNDNNSDSFRIMGADSLDVDENPEIVFRSGMNMDSSLMGEISTQQPLQAVDRDEQDTDCLFLNIAPILTLQQKEMILLSLLGDSVRSIMLQLSVLSKYTMAGKPLSATDISLVLGGPLTKLLPVSLLNQLYRWLKANRRDEHSFKPANPFLVDAGLQRLASFWPNLIINLEPEHDVPIFDCDSVLQASAAPKKNLGLCQIKLRWLNKLELSRMFRDPDKYQPNINCV
eukprot:gene28553-34465_t